MNRTKNNKVEGHIFKQHNLFCRLVFFNENQLSSNHPVRDITLNNSTDKFRFYLGLEI